MSTSDTVDPDRDTPARLKAYARKWKARPGWVWLTGPKDVVEKVLRGMGAYTPLPWAPADLVEDVVARHGVTLFPAGRGDLAMDCTCPDSTVPCKHLAAVFYLLAERFDAVTCISVLEHIPALDGPLAEIRRVLAPGGRFMLSV